MSLAEAGRSRGFIDTGSKSSSVAPQSEQTEAARNLQQEHIRQTVLNIGVQFMDATDGAAIEPGHYENLYKSGWAPYAPEELEQAYGLDWPDFQQLVKDKHSEEVWERWRFKQGVLKEIDTGLAANELDTRLFQKLERVVGPDGGRIKISQTGNEIVQPNVGVLTNESATPDEKITRYLKYKLAKEIIINSGRIPNELRIAGIAIGINITDEDQDRGYLNSGFNSEIHKSTTQEVSHGTVEIMADRAGMFDYIYPDVRKRLLERIKHDSGYRRTKKTLYKPEFSYDVSTGKILIGKAAVESAITAGTHPTDIEVLQQALLRKKSGAPRKEVDNVSHRNFSRDGTLAYGRWLLSVLEPTGRPLNYTIVQTASRMGLGPGELAIATRFDGLDNYFRALGFANKSRNEAFVDWTFDDHVESIKRIAEEIGKRPTRSILSQRVREGKDEPSPYVITNAFGFSAVLEAAGFAPYNQPTTPEEIVIAGVRFYNENGRLPNIRDFRTKTNLGSALPLYKHFGSIGVFREMVLEASSQASP